MYISHVAQVSDTAQVTRQVSLLGLVECEQGRKLTNTFLLHIICCIGLYGHLQYKLSIIHHNRIYLLHVHTTHLHRHTHAYRLKYISVCTHTYVCTYVVVCMCMIHLRM